MLIKHPLRFFDLPSGGNNQLYSPQILRIYLQKYEMTFNGLFEILMYDIVHAAGFTCIGGEMSLKNVQASRAFIGP